MRQVYEYDPVIGYKFIPRLKARVLHGGGGYLIRTNSSGFQSDHEFVPEKDPTKRRILLFGDSFTAGEGVSNGYRYSDCLEETRPDLEIYNYGLPASGTDQQYLMYREYARGIDHDLLVIAVFVENIRRVASRYRRWVDARGNDILFAKPYFELENGKLVLQGSPPQKAPLQETDMESDERQFIAARERFPVLKQMFARARNSDLLGGALANQDLKDRMLKLLRYQPMKEYDDPQNPGWRVMRAILEEWTRHHDRPVLIVPIPLFHYVAGIADASAYTARFREAAESAGAHFFDPLPQMHQPSLQASRELFFDDGHLTRAGHRVLAESLAPAVDEILDARSG